MPFRINLYTYTLLLITILLLANCGGSSDPEPVNSVPTVNNNLSDLTLNAGFGTDQVSLADIFNDDDNDALIFSASSSNQNVATVTVLGTRLTVTEIGQGNTNIMITANDGNGGTVSDTFMLTVIAANNSAPVVANALQDISIDAGFEKSEVNLSNVFTDADSDDLSLVVQNSATNVVTVAITGTTLTVTEISIGVSTITLTASDGNEGSAMDSFTFTVNDAASPCSGDNSTVTSLNECPNTSAQAGLTATFSETIANDKRTIITNGVPDHSFGSPLDKIMANEVTWTMDATPSLANQTTPVLGMSRIDFQFGVALNGVKLDPEAAFPFENTSNGELNYNWMLEATNNTSTTTLDCNQAHLQANGTYHYHGDFSSYADEKGITGNAMVQVGWAADGYPVYYKYAYSVASDANSAIEEMTSSYELKIGEREGDGVSEPCGEYNGRYEQDYKYTEGLGDLDACNGRTGVTPEFPNGTYYYLITADFPLIPRCFSGTPDNSFRVGGG